MLFFYLIRTIAVRNKTIHLFYVNYNVRSSQCIYRYKVKSNSCYDKSRQSKDFVHIRILRKNDIKKYTNLTIKHRSFHVKQYLPLDFSTLLLFVHVSHFCFFVYYIFKDSRRSPAWDIGQRTGTDTGLTFWLLNLSDLVEKV